MLDIPKRGALNVHASLLPKYRGAAPIAGALLVGEELVGVTLMEVVLALDAGPIVARRSLPIAAHDTTGTLTNKMAELGAGLLVEVLPAWERREITSQPQDDAQSTYVKPVRREDAVIDWSLSAGENWRRVRAYNPGRLRRRWSTAKRFASSRRGRSIRRPALHRERLYRWPAAPISRKARASRCNAVEAYGRSTCAAAR